MEALSRMPDLKKLRLFDSCCTLGRIVTASGVPSITEENVLEVKATNLWNNRLIGDLLSPDQQPLARTNMVLKPRDLIPAGLFGPVTIRRAVRRSAGDAAPAPGLAH